MIRLYIPLATFNFFGSQAYKRMDDIEYLSKTRSKHVATPTLSSLLLQELAEKTYQTIGPTEEF